MNKKMHWIAPILLFALTMHLGSCQQEELLTPDDTSGSGTTDPDNISSSYTTATVLLGNTDSHEASSDYTWSASSEVIIQLNGNSISANASSVSINGAIATITKAGAYRISGTLNDGQITVKTNDTDPVRLILDGVNIAHSSSSAIYIAKAEKTILILPDGTKNFLSDGASYVFADPSDDEPNATLFSKDDLTIYGNGSLTIDANYEDGIRSKDGLLLFGPTIAVNAKDDGITGKDYLVVRKGTITVDAGGDALKSTNDEDAKLGYVYIQDGTFNLNAGADGIQAVTDVLVQTGTFQITTGGGSSASTANDTAKGLKAGAHLIIDAGNFTLNCFDDALHSNNNMVINSGSIAISTKDDGIHADTSLIVNGGDIAIGKSYEGLESRVIIINEGKIRVNSSDDGLNVAGGTDGSANTHFPGGISASSKDYYLSIHGGYIAVTAAGDGLDANGSIKMTGGTVLVHGPTAQNNGAIDYDISFAISGGLLVAAGSAGMAQAPGTSSSQYSVLVRFNRSIAAGTPVHIRSSSGEQLLTFQPSKAFQALVFSAPSLQNGKKYILYTGGAHSGTATDGWYSGGSYSPGTEYGSFTISGKVTLVQ